MNFYLQPDQGTDLLLLDGSEISLVPHDKSSIIAKTDLEPGTNVDICLIHHYSDLSDTYHHCQKVDESASLLIIPQGTLKAGRWQIVCQSDLIAEIVGDYWQLSFSLEVKAKNTYLKPLKESLEEAWEFLPQKSPKTDLLPDLETLLSKCQKQKATLEALSETLETLENSPHPSEELTTGLTEPDSSPVPTAPQCLNYTLELSDLEHKISYFFNIAIEKQLDSAQNTIQLPQTHQRHQSLRPIPKDYHLCLPPRLSLTKKTENPHKSLKLPVIP